jgi:hypothetical protein
MVFMAENDLFAALSEQYAAIQAQNEELRESLNDALLSLRIEDANWLKLGSVISGEHEGFGLDELKDISKKIRKHVALTGLIKRGVDLHTGYVHSKGVSIDGVETSGKAGRKTTLQEFFANPVNQESLFNDTARAELQKARYCEGMVLPLCDTKARTVRIIPLDEIEDVKVNPEFPSEIWAYLRTWEAPTSDAAKTEKRQEWIYTARFAGSKQKSYTANGKTIPVRQDAVIADYKFNSQTGWVLGVPDAAAALPHYQGYIEFVQHGKVVTEALAKILYKVTQKKPGGAATAAAKINNFTGIGGTATMTEGSDLEAVRSAGRGYDFSSGDRLAGMMALALNVPLLELLSNSAAAGASYGAASALTPATINAMRIMQREWIAFYHSVFRAFGIPVKEISFPPIQDADPYREGQLRSLMWLTGLIHSDEMRPEVLSLLDIPSQHDAAPEGVMIPNNINSAARTDVDPNGASYSGPDSNSPTKTAPSPDQGRSNGAGGADSTQKNDLAAEAQLRIVTGMQLDEMRQIVDEFRSIAATLKGE